MFKNRCLLIRMSRDIRISRARLFVSDIFTSSTKKCRKQKSLAIKFGLSVVICSSNQLIQNDSYLLPTTTDYYLRFEFDDSF